MKKNIFNILCIGDIIGKAGRKIIENLLPRIILENDVNYIVANGENAAGGLGLVPEIAKFLFEQKINVITSGNHIWSKKEIFPLINNEDRIIRPANFPDNVPGNGFYAADITLNNEIYKIIVINLIGRIFMEPAESPFKKFDEIYNQFSNVQKKIIIIDFHAEATSEKITLGFYVDGRASILFGTHTHIQTADAHILEKGTGYITDIGMCGSENSVIGVDKEIILKKFLTGLPAKNEVSLKEPLIFNAALFTISLQDLKCKEIKSFYCHNVD